MKNRIIIAVLLLVLALSASGKAEAQPASTLVTIAGCIVGSEGGTFQFASIQIFRPRTTDFVSGVADPTTGCFEAKGDVATDDLSGLWHYVTDVRGAQATRGTIELNGPNADLGEVMVRPLLEVKVRATAKEHRDGSTVINWSVDVPRRRQAVSQNDILVTVMTWQPTRNSLNGLVVSQQQLRLNRAAGHVVIPPSPRWVSTSTLILLTRVSDPTVVLSYDHGFYYSGTSGLTVF